MTSMPLPASRRMSTTAKAGGRRLSDWSPSSTEAAASTSKPRVSMARASRARKARSSSTIRSVLSASTPKSVGGAGEACRASIFRALLVNAALATPRGVISQRIKELFLVALRRDAVELGALGPLGKAMGRLWRQRGAMAPVNQGVFGGD